MSVKLLVAALAVSTIALPIAPAAYADSASWDELSNLGIAALHAHEYEKADIYFTKALKKVRKGSGNERACAITLRHLGEAYMHEDRFEEAREALTKSVKELHTLGDTVEREKAQAALNQLKQEFRRIDPDDLGETAAQLLKRIGIKYITIQRLKQGQRISIKLNDKMEKQVTSERVERIGLDKVVSFDVIRDNAGNMRLANIRGLRVKTKFWVNLTEYSVASNSSGETTSSITGKKLGITKTVSHQMSENAMRSAHSVMNFWKNMRDTMLKMQDHNMDEANARADKAIEEAVKDKDKNKDKPTEAKTTTTTTTTTTGTAAPESSTTSTTSPAPSAEAPQTPAATSSMETLTTPSAAPSAETPTPPSAIPSAETSTTPSAASPAETSTTFSAAAAAETSKKESTRTTPSTSPLTPSSQPATDSESQNSSTLK